MKDNIEKEFALMVENLVQTEFCSDWNPKLLHGFMGIASEAGELLNGYKSSTEIGGEFHRTTALIEISDLVHYMQMIIGELGSSISEVLSRDLSCINSVYTRFWDEQYLSSCGHLDSVLLRGFMGIASAGGELLNRYKKFLFYHGEPFTKDEMLDHLLVLFHYIQMTLVRLDSTLEEVIRINMAKLGSRYPDGYAHDKAITHRRDKKAERAAVEAVIESKGKGRE